MSSIPVSPFYYFSKIKERSKSSIMDFDFFGIDKEGKPVIIEYLKRGEKQPDYITPLTSHINNYIRFNKGKFTSFKQYQEKLDATIYYINYAPQNTIIKGKNIGEQFKIMKQVNISFGRKKNGKPQDIITSDISFTNSVSFEKYLKDNILSNLQEIPKIDQDFSSFVDIKNIDKILAKGENLYQKQLSQIRENQRIKKKVALPDLSADLLELRFPVLKKFKSNISFKDYNPYKDKFYLYVALEKGSPTYKDALDIVNNISDFKMLRYNKKIINILWLYDAQKEKNIKVQIQNGKIISITKEHINDIIEKNNKSFFQYMTPSNYLGGFLK